MFDYLLDWNIRFANGPTHLSTVTVSFNVFNDAVRTCHTIVQQLQLSVLRLEPCPHCDSQNATVTENGDCRWTRRQSPFWASVAEFATNCRRFRRL